jgi:hypothetical protein
VRTDIKRQAAISDCGKFRYALSREWNTDKPLLVFIMLNPSTADALLDDPTIRKCIGFAERNGFGAAEVYNLFAYRATDPKDLKRAGYPVGPENDPLLFDMLRQLQHDSSFKVVCAWGANARDQQIGIRAMDVTRKLHARGIKLHHLRLTADGIPCHPLMLPYSCGINEWSPHAR